ncbi:hypothetical protein ABZ858_32515 [Streptomyces sp. NPDC047017]|uniref:hypothetical protein n=1 Tax=Streptomyces sp. NPDC047017 TaxID=3155024 RepID=UPI0033FA54BD
MPFPPSPRADSGPRRRSLLASAAGAALLAGCSAGTDDSGAGGGTPVADRVRAAAAGDSQELVRRYDAVLAAHPALAPRLGPLRAEVVRHAAAFGAAGTASPAASTTPPAATAPTAAAGATPGAASGATPGATGPGGLAATEKDALAALAAAERSLADRRAAALLQVPGELARLLASVAAAGAAHAYLLTEGDK